jgi:hypothetical protein
VGRQLDRLGPLDRSAGLLVGRTHLSWMVVSLVGGEPGVPCFAVIKKLGIHRSSLIGLFRKNNLYSLNDLVKNVVTSNNTMDPPLLFLCDLNDFICLNVYTVTIKRLNNKSSH